MTTALNTKVTKSTLRVDERVGAGKEPRLPLLAGPHVLRVAGPPLI
jgi:hypothetical protein